MSVFNYAKSGKDLYKNAISVEGGGKAVREAAAKWRIDHGQNPMGVNSDTLCWLCEKSCTKECSWARSFDPVEGWDAEETVIAGYTNLIQSFFVKNCPEFLPSDPDFYNVPSPCRWCRRRPTVRKSWTGKYRLEHITSCGQKRVTAYMTTEAEAIAAWNKGETRIYEHGKRQKKN